LVRRSRLHERVEPCQGLYSSLPRPIAECIAFQPKISYELRRNANITMTNNATIQRARQGYLKETCRVHGTSTCMLDIKFKAPSSGCWTYSRTPERLLPCRALSIDLISNWPETNRSMMLSGSPHDYGETTTTHSIFESIEHFFDWCLVLELSKAECAISVL
jgi:hypothetical protein